MFRDRIRRLIASVDWAQLLQFILAAAIGSGTAVGLVQRDNVTPAEMEQCVKKHVDPVAEKVDEIDSRFTPRTHE